MIVLCCIVLCFVALCCVGFGGVRIASCGLLVSLACCARNSPHRRRTFRGDQRLKVAQTGDVAGALVQVLEDPGHLLQRRLGGARVLVLDDQVPAEDPVVVASPLGLLLRNDRRRYLAGLEEVSASGDYSATVALAHFSQNAVHVKEQRGRAAHSENAKGF